MKHYNGIIFNSVNVELLKGTLGEAVKSHNTRTAVVSRKNRSEVKRILKKLGVNVDFIAGAADFNTRYKTYVKPMADPFLIAVAMLHLDAGDVAVLGDYKLDREGADNAGLD